MIEVARVTAQSTAPVEAFFEKWCDIESHPQWAASMEYFRLNGPFGVGATGVAKARGGSENRFEVTVVDPPGTYADATHLDGAILTVMHQATAAVSGGTDVLVYAYLEGPDAAAWAERMGDGVQQGISGDVAALVDMLEGS